MDEKGQTGPNSGEGKGGQTKAGSTMFFCGISGETPVEPVVSVKSKKVYERRLILKYIAENGTDPVTGDALQESDLIAIEPSSHNPPPRPPTHSSIPSLLHALQNEWDALVLEMYALRQQYNSTRQELSYALYSQDAATRVVARLLRERDAARESVSPLSRAHSSDRFLAPWQMSKPPWASPRPTLPPPKT